MKESTKLRAFKWFWIALALLNGYNAAYALASGKWIVAAYGVVLTAVCVWSVVSGDRKEARARLNEATKEINEEKAALEAALPAWTMLFWRGSGEHKLFTTGVTDAAAWRAVRDVADAKLSEFAEFGGGQ